MTFNEKYVKIKKMVQPEISVIEDMMLSGINVREPLNSHIKKFLSLPSKRIRSVFTILYLKSQGKNLSENQLKLLSSVEIVHNASLIHDDIIDESEFRRGQKTIHSDFDNKLAVISGDYLLSVAMEQIASLNSVEILGNFSKTLKHMCTGEINQNYDKFKIISIEDYINKSKNKTAYLFETAVICSEILANEKNLSSASEFALNFGIAFQIRDDLLNVLKSDATKPSKDIEDGVYNAPVIYSGSAINFYDGIEKTKDLLNNYIRYAKKHIESIDKNKYTDLLLELLESLADE